MHFTGYSKIYQNGKISFLNIMQQIGIMFCYILGNIKLFAFIFSQKRCCCCCCLVMSKSVTDEEDHITKMKGLCKVRIIHSVKLFALRCMFTSYRVTLLEPVKYMYLSCSFSYIRSHFFMTETYHACRMYH